MDLRRVLSTENSRIRAIFLLKFESLTIFAIVLYLLIAPFISDVSAPAALSAEIIFGLLACAGLWFSAIGFAKKRSFGRAPAVLASTCSISQFNRTGSLLLHDYWQLTYCWYPTCNSCANNFIFSRTWLR